jgi:hypothetical protein
LVEGIPEEVFVQDADVPRPSFRLRSKKKGIIYNRRHKKIFMHGPKFFLQNYRASNNAMVCRIQNFIRVFNPDQIQIEIARHC